MIDAQELLAEEKVDEAIVSLKSWLGELEDDSLDKALTLQTLGYAEMGQGTVPSRHRVFTSKLGY
ncbi:MAG: hypothetical protein CM15mP120_04220 [Pseudomonadota bacterium]|nr:MAG: hypothetical protein CM15mP120_04220 [Pseudomonadota bacterium]